VFSGKHAGRAVPAQRDGQVHGDGISLEQVVDHDDHGAREDHQPRAQDRHFAGRRARRRRDHGLVEGPATFVDTRNNKRDGKLQLKPVQTVINGVPFGRPYQSPFSAR